MGLPNSVSRNMQCRTRWTNEVTLDELFAAKVKLAGALILIFVDALILVVVGFPP